MDADTLPVGLQELAGFGRGLTQSQKSSIHTSLIITQSQNKFSAIRFWGTISGIKEDYFIVYGINKDELNGRKYMYSLNCMDWHLLQDPSAETMSKTDVIRGRFIGDPSYEYEHVDVQRIGEGDDAHDEETVFTIKEEDRLSAIVKRITEEFVVPRGAFLHAPNGLVYQNKGYFGHSESDSAHLSTWFHLRKDAKHQIPKVTEFADADPAVDFLATIENDIPNGVWSVQNQNGRSIILKNLHWIGLVAYTVPDTRLHGCAYFGTGEPNYDLPFML
jgi:radial spoke head protein 9